MLSRRGGNLLFVILMATTMSLVMSFAMTLVNSGFNSAFLDRWMRSFGIGLLVSVPTALLIVPVLRRFVDGLVR